jgi:hypothetical protein
LPIEQFQRLAQFTSRLAPWPSRRVRRRGFEAGFQGSRILVPQGIETSQMRLRAAYVEAPLTFQHILQAIVFPSGQEHRAKLLTALLNSRVAIWFAFHGTASFGSDRPKVHQAELLHLPFPPTSDLPDPERAERAAAELIGIIDEAIEGAKRPFALSGGEDGVLSNLDKFAYDYFCLSDDEIILIEDAANKIFPAVQPHEGSCPEIWKAPARSERKQYADTLSRSIGDWIKGGRNVDVQLEACSADLGVLRVALDGAGEAASYDEESRTPLEKALGRVFKHVQQPLDGNFQLMPDLRVFVGKNLYLIKPMQRRFWLKSTALADADAIAMDLQDAVEVNQRRSQA